MANSPVVKIGLTFSDRDSNSAKMTCYCAFATSIADAWAFAFVVADRASAMSDAVITGIDIAYRWTIDDPAAPGDSSSIERKILMLMVNSDDEINGMIVPSPKAELWETTGSYAGIRLDLAGDGALAWIDMLAALDLLTVDGRLLGSLVVGGLAL